MNQTRGLPFWLLLTLHVALSFGISFSTVLATSGIWSNDESIFFCSVHSCDILLFAQRYAFLYILIQPVVTVPGTLPVSFQ